MRYVLIEAVKINDMVYQEGTECVAVSANEVPKRYSFLRKIAERVESCMDQKRLVVRLDGEIRLIPRRAAERLPEGVPNSLPTRL